MKKILLATALSVFATSALAAEVGSYYVGADLGASMLPQQKVNSLNNAKLKSASHFVGSVRVGTYVLENVRTELALSNHFSATQKNAKSSAAAKVKPTVTALTLKGLVDVYNFGAGDVFVGAGLGYSSVAGKYTSNGTTTKWKKQGNFSYLLTAGVSVEATDGVKVDLAYGYNDHGKLSKVKGNGSKTKYNFRSHDLTVGARVEL